MKWLFVGGQRDGQEHEVAPGTIWFEVDGEAYIRVVVKGEQPFFMLCGMTPAWAVKRARELRAESVA